MHKHTLQNPLRLSLSTLSETSSLLGHPLDDRTAIRKAQQKDLLLEVQEKTMRLLDEGDTKSRFYFGSIDFLVYQNAEGNRQVLPIEINGSNMGGIANLPLFVLESILDELAEIPPVLETPAPMMIVPYARVKNPETANKNPLIYERILYAQTLKEAFQRLGKTVRIQTLPEFIQNPAPASEALILMGPLKDLAELLGCDQGLPTLNGRPFQVCVHDGFSDAIFNRFGDRISREKFVTVNDQFSLTMDKGHTYEQLNRLLANKTYGLWKTPIFYQHAGSETELFEKVLALREQGKRLVIKPHASHTGRGIEFFISTEESPEEIREKIRASIAAVQFFSVGQDNCFPYTICEYVDSEPVRAPGHRFDGHKYELRVFVYREQNTLKAAPSIVKFSKQRFDPAHTQRLMLLNNITTSGTEFAMPFCNRENLALLQLSEEQLTEICRISTDFVHWVTRQAFT